MRNTLVGLGGWIKNSLIDYPGTVSTVLFFSGCNLRCPYCHNKLLVNRVVDQSMRSAEIWDFLAMRVGLIDGIVLSGGEPTLYPYLHDTVAEFQSMGYRVKLDTNGLMPEIAESFKPDYLALDIKCLPADYSRLLGAQYSNVELRLKRSLDMVRAMGDRAEVRITVAPRIVDCDVASGLTQLLRGVTKVFLQPMNNAVELLNPSWESLAPVASADIRAMCEIISESVGICAIRGELP